MRMIKIRIRATGQVTDMVPAVARAMINGGTAEEVKPAIKLPRELVDDAGPIGKAAAAGIESMAVGPPSRKPMFSRKRAG